VAEGDHVETGVGRGEIKKAKQARQKHLGLRVFVGARSAVTSSADFSRASLERLADETCALARVIAPDPIAGLPDPAELASAVPDPGLYDAGGSEVTAQQALEWAKEGERAGLESDPPITNSQGPGCGRSPAP